MQKIMKYLTMSLIFLFLSQSSFAADVVLAAIEKTQNESRFGDIIVVSTDNGVTGPTKYLNSTGTSLNKISCMGKGNQAVCVAVGVNNNPSHELPLGVVC